MFCRTNSAQLEPFLPATARRPLLARSFTWIAATRSWACNPSETVRLMDSSGRAPPALPVPLLRFSQRIPTSATVWNSFCSGSSAGAGSTYETQQEEFNERRRDRRNGGTVIVGLSQGGALRAGDQG